MSIIYKSNLGTAKKTKLHIKPAETFLIGFLAVILFGAFLLTLPISSRSGQWTSPLTALFTATSATCVTGLVVVDTYTYWTVFGQIVILLLIQTGGLGFMTIATLFSLLIRRNISMSERLIIMQGLNLDDMSGIVRLTKRVLLGTLMFEGAGALILSVRFASDFGWIKGIYKGIFHSVSAFCNAGFDILGDRGKFSSITTYQDDVVVNVVIMALIVIGGLGFFVWDDIAKTKNFKGLKVYSKMVLIITASLIFGGAVLFALFEMNNTAITAGMSVKSKILAPLFQSVTTRTAGFNSISEGDMTSASKILSCLLMFIGGSSGSTAGGIKTFTFGLLIMMTLSALRGRRDVIVFGRKIGSDNVLRAISLTLIAVLLLFVSACVISLFEPFPLLSIIFECCSAFGTVGLTVGITPLLSPVSKLVLILLMYLGRVGVLTITLGIAMQLNRNKNLISYPEAKVLIG
ncbi:MAG: TrkH family potassium uptake protein [Bacillota bacterium]|nr:TrkH family potassium uptake protein [Bacillota bacterium]